MFYPKKTTLLHFWSDKSRENPLLSLLTESTANPCCSTLYVPEQEAEIFAGPKLESRLTKTSQLLCQLSMLQAKNFLLKSLDGTHRETPQKTVHFSRYTSYHDE